MNTTEGNKLIAEFMGFSGCIVRNHKGVKYDYTLPSGFDLIKEVETTIEGNWCEVLEEQDNCFTSDLKFHSSWDWLMQVVEKIDNVCGIDLHDWDASINESLCTKQIKIVWSEVVEFMKWYNENK